jgi:hypothetical protein
MYKYRYIHKYIYRYGYSLVGKVVATGKDLNQDEWLDKLIFTFSPHSTVAIIDSSSAMIVPEGTHGFYFIHVCTCLHLYVYSCVHIIYV